MPKIGDSPLNAEDCKAVDSFAIAVLTAFKEGDIGRARAVKVLQHAIVAAARGDLDQLRNFVRVTPRELFEE